MKYIEDIERELLHKCEDVPFGNSLYQSQCFIINQSYTKARALRACGLALNSSIRGLRDLEISQARKTIDIEELEERLKTETNPFEVRRIKLTIQEKRSDDAISAKLLKDAIYEIEYFRGVMDKLPKMNREEFELAEPEYYKRTLTRQAIGVGEAQNSLNGMGHKGTMTPEINLDEPTVTERLGTVLLPCDANHICEKLLRE